MFQMTSTTYGPSELYVKYLTRQDWHKAKLLQIKDYDDKYYEYVKLECNSIARPVTWTRDMAWKFQSSKKQPKKLCERCVNGNA